QQLVAGAPSLAIGSGTVHGPVPVHVGKGAELALEARNRERGHETRWNETSEARRGVGRVEGGSAQGIDARDQVAVLVHVAGDGLLGRELTRAGSLVQDRF